jgi:hypothetical protein
VNLPWVTELYEPSSMVFRDHVKKHSGGGEPGWTVSCTVLGKFIKIQDECLAKEGTNTGIAAVAAGINATFDSISNENPANCSLGGANTGLVEGTDTIENPTGHQLAVK